MKKVDDTLVMRKWQSLRESAKSRDLDFNLTFTSVKNLLRAEKCYYTGVRFMDNNGGSRSMTVDRKNPKKGYVLGNVVACTMAFNTAKANVEHLGKKGVRAYIRQLEKFANELED